MGPAERLDTMRRARWIPLAMVAALLVPLPLGAGQVPPLPRPEVSITLETWAPTEEPEAGTWQPFLLGSNNQFRPRDPPALLSLEGALELLEVRLAQLERTPQQTARAEFWDEGPASQRWTELMLDLVSAYGPNPPRVARGLALLHVAMYDATIAAWEAKHYYNRPPPSAVDITLQPAFEPRSNPSYPSEHAAVAGAAARILGYLYPQYGVNHLEDLAEEAGASRVWAGVNWPSDVEAGLELGREVADLVLAHASADRSNKAWDGAVPDVDCRWRPTPPGNVYPPLEPTWGQVKTWLMSSGNQFRAPPPPECDGAEWDRQTLDLYEKVTTLTDEERAIALYWADGPNTVTPPGHWNLIALHMLEHHPLSTPRAARAFAYLGAVLHDAGVGVWDTKFTYWVERPITTIRDHIDPGFTSVVTTPPFPGYVSGHSGFSGASARWLGHVFPDEEVALRAMAFEAALSRFYAGIHIMADNLVGVDLGHNVADLAIARAMDDGAE